MPTGYKLEGEYLVPREGSEGREIQLIDHDKKVIKTNASVVFALYKGASKDDLVEAIPGISKGLVENYFLNDSGKIFPVKIEGNKFLLDVVIPYNEMVAMIKHYHKEEGYFIPHFLSKIIHNEK